MDYIWNFAIYAYIVFAIINVLTILVVGQTQYCKDMQAMIPMDVRYFFNSLYVMSSGLGTFASILAVVVAYIVLVYEEHHEFQ